MKRRASCHHCGNMRKQYQICSKCPYVYCMKCREKMVQQYESTIFENGCPVCKQRCCCAKKSANCTLQHHCYKKCLRHKLSIMKAKLSDDTNIVNSMLLNATTFNQCIAMNPESHEEEDFYHLCLDVSELSDDDVIEKGSSILQFDGVHSSSAAVVMHNKNINKTNCDILSQPLLLSDHSTKTFFSPKKRLLARRGFSCYTGLLDDSPNNINYTPISDIDSPYEAIQKSITPISVEDTKRQKLKPEPTHECNSSTVSNTFEEMVKYLASQEFILDVEV